MGPAAESGELRTRTGPRDEALRFARRCYNHLAGTAGVRMYDSLIRRGYLSVGESGLSLSTEGRVFVEGLGIDVQQSSVGRAPLCRECLDWSERKARLAGRVGRALLDRTNFAERPVSSAMSRLGTLPLGRGCSERFDILKGIPMAEQTGPAPMDRHETAMGLGPLSIFIRKLLNRSRLSTLDQQALANLPYKIQNLDVGTQILREGDRALVCPILLDGFTYRYKVAADGGRQIVALKVPGDALDFQSAYLHTADHDIRALTPVVIAMVPLRAIESLAEDRPAIARALLVDTILEGSIGREWLLNIGRRNAEARLAHLLCELYYRIDEIAGAPLDTYEVPITQEQLADLLGLTPVHINRMLKRLEGKGAIRSGRRLHILDLAELERISDFSDIYLHRNNVPA